MKNQQSITVNKFEWLPIIICFRSLALRQPPTSSKRTPVSRRLKPTHLINEFGKSFYQWKACVFDFPSCWFFICTMFQYLLITYFVFFFLYKDCKFSKKKKTSSSSDAVYRTEKCTVRVKANIKFIANLNLYLCYIYILTWHIFR